MKIRLKHQISGVAFLAAVLPVLAILVLSFFQRKQASAYINNTMQEMIIEDLTHVIRDFYSLCETANDFTQQYVNHSLNIAHEKLYQQGQVKLVSKKITWHAVNQFDGQQSDILLPKMAIGRSWLGQNKDINIQTAVVDDVKTLLGATCTIFQRMNEQGDMLRVATNVETLDHSRAIGTYIPAVNPDGSDNPVIASVMMGKTFHGRAYVVNNWYLTAYETIKDENETIIGMLYVGVKQESAESFRESILRTKVGNKGYLYALGSSGDQKGQYIISKNGKRDSEFIWNEKDADGNYSVRDIINNARKLQNGKIKQKRYNKKELNDIESREIITLYTYFEPWDWVIGAIAYEEDYQDAKANVDRVISSLVTQSILFGLITLILVTILAIYLSAKITKPLIQMADAAKALTAGDISQTITYSGEDEVGLLAKSYNKMSREIQTQREKLQDANKQLTEANTTKDKFFSIIAHDLKNPFNTLLTYSATLVKQFNLLDKNEIKKGLETLHNTSKRGYNLLVDLLTWARSQSGKIEINCDNIDLNQISHENVSLLSERAKEKGIKIYSEVEDNVFAYADKNMVSTVIRNLLTNAVKFTSAGGEVKISAQHTGDHIHITIADTGIGICKENIKKLFRLDTFYRTMGTEKEKGTGLGLILCREFVEKLDGKIWIESELGKGSRFIFTLPLVLLK